MCKHYTKALLLLITTLFVVSVAAAQSSKVIASNQHSDGIKQRDMDQGFLYRYREYEKEILLTNLRQQIEAMGKRLPANFDVPAETFYITAGGRKLATIRFKVSGANSIHLLGIIGDTMHRVTCVNQSEDEVSLFYGPCANKLKEVFGVNLNGSFDVEHLRFNHDPSYP
jgi:hypothetical protein